MSLLAPIPAAPQPVPAASQPSSNLAGVGAAQKTPAIEGEWHGTLALPNRDLALTLQIGADGSGTLATPEVPAAAILYSTSGNRITFAISSPEISGSRATYAATVYGNRMMTGTWSQPGANYPLTMTRTANVQPPGTASGPQSTASAVPAVDGGAVRIDSKTATANLISSPDPVYPPLAKMARQQGTVTFEVTIGKDGKSAKVQLVSGPPLLVQAATDAVKQRVWKPILVNGASVVAITTVDVTFSLAGTAPAAPAR
jgi:protein TonB